MRILLTGGPAAGKTEVARLLAAILSYKTVSEKDYCRQKKIGPSHDGELVVDPKELEKSLSKDLKGVKDVILEGHMLSNVKLDLDYVFILRTSIRELEKRLSKRFYSDKKIWDNVIVEGIDYCRECCFLNYEEKKIIEIDTTGKTPREVAERIAGIVSNKSKGGGDKVNWGKQMGDYLVKNPPREA